MTELMTAASLLRCAQASEQPDVSLGPGVPVLHWGIDSETGQAVGYWILAEKRRPSELSLTTQSAVD